MKLKLKSFNKTVAAAATPEQLIKTPLITSNARIKALNSNTNPVFIGGDDAQLFPLLANQELSLNELFSKSGVDEVNLQEVYCRVTTNGEGVSIIYGSKE